MDNKKYIHYQVFKNIVPESILFIHGNLSSNRWWYPMLESVGQKPDPTLAGDIILAEIRGCGHSSDVDEVEKISIISLADEFAQFISSLNIKLLNIVGHSTGGSIAFILLAKLAKNINRGVLVDPVGARGRKFDQAILTAFHNMKADLGLVADIMKVTIKSPNIDPQFFRDVVVTDAARAAKVMGLKIAEAFGEFNYLEKLSQINCPVLVLHGDQDQVLPISDSKELARLIPGAQFETLQGLGHCPILEDPERLWLVIKRFLFT